MKKLIIITGVNKGLGKAFFNLFFKDEDTTIIAISRNLNEQQKKIKGKFSRVVFIEKNLSYLKDVDKELALKKYYLSEFKEVIFINNAATINPIKLIGGFKDESILYTIQLNTIAPILLSNHIIKHNSNRLVRIFNISSGAASKPIIGWSLYCTTKSANEMFFKSLKAQEENNKLVEVYNLDPGVMDTDMQKNIRSKDEKAMPNVRVFKDYHENEKLKSAKDVAKEIVRTYKII